ncbi:T-complex protein 1 subunit gamma [Puccinia graminis f. sp. tritici]|uniref:T-complex protein 1 subunit gamma n=1 Tax=Puccinia graminis f. sp. tritici TaxID=56615 RepID=A0A5B0PV16_PUCGR|nr:T-complex protein 1 subunit gamma [Puccinia graminis f. sp. tritici]KAA1097240.1 T-complex protein 1 subunit gamma [Puccinia graminis f. sp. tritici]KAA1104622.1 T-complex protein 1 subunit gamma [Puccinia graminis f. sp. tritici]KAA1112183.1 T-complex protein 1 subunit gamma [Puccinia graminis f. sp. tritici]
MSAPVMVMNAAAPQRQTGRKAQISNITAAKTVADVIRTCLGPKAMLKMILDPMGGILLTNDGNAILREIEVAHPAAKSMIELSRTQDEECGDGTTSIIILAGEILASALPHLERNIHPVVIIRAFKRALAEALSIIDRICITVDVTNDAEMLKLIKTSIGTKFSSRWSPMMCKLALQAVRVVSTEENGRKEVDIKRYARVEKIPGGAIEDSRVLDGVMLNKDITHPKMRRRIENPRIILLDCPLEYKKGESQTNIELAKEGQYERFLEIEEEQIKASCEKIIQFKPDLVFCEKGVSDLAQHFFLKANVSAIRRVRKSDNNRIARATGATIVNRVEDLRDTDVGTQCGLFHVEKIADDYFTFLTGCEDPKACTIMLRGPSKDIINEIDRNLADAMAVARNVVFDPRLAPGGGATEMAISVGLAAKSKTIEGVEGWPFKTVGEAMEVIPRTLIQNCGGNTIRTLTELRAKHANGEHEYGVDGDTGKITDMKTIGLYESAAVKVQIMKTAVESACLLLRVDDIVSAKRPRRQDGGGAPQTMAAGDGGDGPEQ